MEDFPKTFKKFYSCNENSFAALKNRYFWAAFPYQFNDPFDCSPILWDNNSFLKNGLDRNTSLQNILSNTGIVCLNNPQEEFENLLWGYYTDQSGFSVEFNQGQLSMDFSKGQGTYLEKVKCYKKSDFEKFRYSKDQHEFSLEVIKWIKQKEDIWEMENEWRYIFFDCNYVPGLQSGDIKTRKKGYSKEAIRSITLGIKFFEGYLLDKTENGFIYDLSKSENKFTIEILKLLTEDLNYKMKWMHLTQDLRMEARSVNLKNENPDRIEIEYL